MYDDLQFLYEGIYDPAIYKALFVIGGPGSGKSFVSKKLGLPHMGFVQINSDYPLEKYMVQNNLDLKMPEHESEARNDVRDKAKRVTQSKEEKAIEQGLGLYIDGTGANKNSTVKMEKALRSMGYDVAMVFVNANIGTAVKRNAERARSVPNHILKNKWLEVQENIGFYQNHFDNFFVVDNSNGQDSSGQIQQVYKKILKWVRSPVNKRAGKKIADEVSKRGITDYR